MEKLSFQILMIFTQEEILKEGVGLNEALKSIEIVSSIRNSKISRQGKNTFLDKYNSLIKLLLKMINVLRDFLHFSWKRRYQFIGYCF